MWRSGFTEQYGLQVPFVSAGMGFLALPELAAAVSEAGGLGLLGAAPAPAPLVREMVRRLKALTARPFGVDLIVETTALGPCTTEEHIEVCAAEGVPVVLFFWHAPPAAWVDRLRRAGAKVWMTVGSVEQARKAVRLGLDAVVVQSAEAGGHNRATAGALALVPAVADAVAPVPVVAAGGIADGRGVAAALALGAAAVCVGTRLLASREAYAHDEYKRRVVAAGTSDVARTSIFGPEWPDQPMRVLRNRVVRDWEGRDDRTPPAPDPTRPIGRTVLLGRAYEMPKFSAVPPTPEAEGDFEEMCLAAGEGAGLVRDIRPAGEIVREMMEEARRVIEGRLLPLIGRAPGG
jgi:NAD(P)H-dependent flavin oxidoreductase YrpB (nitropropane dioxygenase family)